MFYICFPLHLLFSLSGRALYTLLCSVGSIDQDSPSFGPACHRYLICTIGQGIALCVSLTYF